MCYFITIGIPTNAVSVLDEFRRDYHIEVHSNLAIQKAFGPQHEMFTITLGGCSCSLYSPPEDQQGNQQEKLRAKYKKKGWSPGKIRRAIADKARMPHHKFNGLRADLRHKLARMVSDSQHLLILVHHYSGTIGTENINLASRMTISVPNLLKDNFAVLEDVLVRVQA